MFGFFSPCKQLIKYQGFELRIATLKGEIAFPIEVNGVKVKKELLQTAGEIAQILDWAQFTACQRIQILRSLKDVRPDVVVDLILRQQEDAEMLARLAIIAVARFSQSKRFEELLADWIAEAYIRIRPSTPKTRWLLRESHPSYSERKLKLLMRRAAEAFPYLSERLANPKRLDIEESLGTI
jgi:hypothetical protein